LREHSAALLGLKFSPDDQVVILWDVEKILSLDSLEYACDWAKDYLNTNAMAKDSNRKVTM